MARDRGTGVAWDFGAQVRLTMRVEACATVALAALEDRALLTRVSLHNVQVFRLLLKTSVERNTNEFKLFLVGFAVRPSPVSL